MQSTIDYMYQKDEKLLDTLLQFGEPEIKEIKKKILSNIINLSYE